MEDYDRMSYVMQGLYCK